MRQYAEAIIALVRADIRDGRIPPDVRSFSDLHAYVDANEYADDVGVPQSAGDYDLVNAVESRVDEMLAAGSVDRSGPADE
ncbi:hypothetical protein GCM10009557_03170 [Virgisporangium ochraceum]|uniref:Uncharacterized protein n=1 Tax=Virgisporangium ochraceum TaxID=65505 RepID=A0A8J3ZQC6_9ACTN|nr:hypothetical protein [Virgisporangium ochraceum]GIJ67979.1 hypothetical protein Voc01_028960 [Virgisporangium ochraceum]